MPQVPTKSSKSQAKAPKNKKARLDQELVTRGLFETREQAQRAIMAGEVKIGTRVAAKASESVASDARIQVAAPAKYVSRGGLKLEGALDAWLSQLAARQR